MEELFWRDPRGSLRFLSGLMQAGFIHGITALLLMAFTLYHTWDSEATCDRALRGWLGFQVVLQVIQFPSRWYLYSSLPQCEHPQTELLEPTEGERREEDQRIIDGLVALVHSRRWTLNRLFGLLALGWFLVGIWWTIRARGCAYSPLLYNVCVSLLWLFCTRTAFVFLWFGFIFGNQQTNVGYAGPFRKPGASAAMLEKLAVVKFENTDVASEELSCSICLCDFEAPDELRRLPCKHYFHVRCIDSWLRISRACPMCNADVAAALPEPDKEHVD